MKKDLSDLQIHHAKGIGQRRALLFGRLGITTIKDALYYLPWRYDDRRNLKCIGDLISGERGTVRGRVLSATIKMIRRRLNVFEVTVNDGSGSVKAEWFNQPFLKNNFKAGDEVVLSGMVKAGAAARFACLHMDNPEYEFLAEDNDSFIHTNRIVPIYRLTEGISQKQFRKLMFEIVHDFADLISDPLTGEILERRGLPPLRECVRQLHFPEDGLEVDALNRYASPYHERFRFEELFLLALGMATIRKNNRLKRRKAFPGEGKKLQAFRRKLPFKLTNGQERAFEDILRDMGSSYPMHRLLQGDVGSGKTVVAFMAMLHTVECGYQAVLMAPTEVLAEQHYLTLRGMMDDLGVRSALLTGGSGRGQRGPIGEGKKDIIVGTHALIQQGIKFKKMGLAVIDEQHKFGVRQRVLLSKKGKNPHILVMTATPIPRSLALSMYGDLDYSVIDDMPAGRQAVVTRVFSPDHKTAIYGVMDAEIKKGRQVYVVYPSIEGTVTGDLRAAVQGREAFQRIFPDMKVGLLHGGTAIAEREKIMRSFKRGGIDILVCTTVIEVGVDVPNASMMIVIHAERFGLAQLHQLRGRVGRGPGVSHCLLVAYPPISDEARRRLDIMAESTDGFRIAEEDLSIRGPGEFLGTRQSGMPDLRVADIIKDVDVLEAARKEARHMLDSGPGPEELPFLKKSLETFWKTKTPFFETTEGGSGHDREV